MDWGSQFDNFKRSINTCIYKRIFGNIFPIVTMTSSKVFIVFVFCNIFGEPFSNGNLVSTATKLQQRGSRQTLENETATCAEGQKGTCTWCKGNRGASCSSPCNVRVSIIDCYARGVGLRTVNNVVNCFHAWQNKGKGPLFGKCNCSINQ